MRGLVNVNVYLFAFVCMKTRYVLYGRLLQLECHNYVSFSYVFGQFQPCTLYNNYIEKISCVCHCVRVNISFLEPLSIRPVADRKPVCLQANPSVVHQRNPRVTIYAIVFVNNFASKLQVFQWSFVAQK